jgi:hypothetical protein
MRDHQGVELFYVLVCPANLHRQMFGALRGDTHSLYHRTPLPFHRPPVIAQRPWRVGAR